jgi:hypothetical protein
METGESGHTTRYVALCILGLVLVSLLFPALDGLNLAGFLNDKTYLLILQDNGEIRNTGGEIACMGLLTLHDGNVKGLQVWNSYVGQTNATVRIDEPQSFIWFFGTEYVKLYDANVQYDFASFAPFMLSSFYNVTGRHVDGIIAVDFTALKEILKLTGPISVSGHNLTSRNVADMMYYYSAQSKAELVNLLSELGLTIARIIHDSSPPLKVAFFNAARQLVSEKHLQFYVPGDFVLQAFGSASTPPQADFVSVVDYNLGSAKADPGIHRSIDSHVEILANGSTISRLTVTWTNDDWWDYNVFTTVLIPAKAEVTEASHHAQTFEGPLKARGPDFTALSARVVVPANGTCSVTYTYEQPKNVHGNGLGQHYDLYVQKQAGIDAYTLDAAVQLPPGATLIHSENVGADQVATGDTHVEVVYM